MSKIISHERALEDAQATEHYGREIGRACRGGERIALSGELGAGKTTFMRGFAEGLGLDASEVSSPTFTLLHVHESPLRDTRLVHGDAYRLGSLDELEEIGWTEYLADPKTVVVLEWPEKVPGALGAEPLHIELMHGVADAQGRIGRFARCVAPGSPSASTSSRRCPSCNAAVPEEASAFPFCSARCRMADLGNWFSGRYSVSREIEEDDLMNPDLS